MRKCVHGFGKKVQYNEKPT